ncbi:hypothetical protein [Gracilimonas mengyeensis]|uniref:Uncharacterized protein n=1 Tax=Gracilimonas mengyeensis TaxID=1302730 RepID=A0A521DEA7_9BACT|nr:hypothetical protein [Gracilimonas mengyeensis]SMO69300.1 hypothetical protein SAMN06265219_10828 [Gracilimonas mengyeensis]
MIKKMFLLPIVVAFMTMGSTDADIKKTPEAEALNACQPIEMADGSMVASCMASPTMSCVSVGPGGTISFGVSPTFPDPPIEFLQIGN